MKNTIFHFFKITYVSVGMVAVCAIPANATNVAFLSKNSISSISRTASSSKGDSISTKDHSKPVISLEPNQASASHHNKLLVAGSCIVQNENFPTSVASGTSINGFGTNTLSGWTVGGTYTATAPWNSSRGYIDLRGVGLVFERDASTVSYVQKTVTVPANLYLVLNNVKWINNGTDGDASTTSILEIKLGGVLYATINTGTTNAGATVTTAGGASTNFATLGGTSGPGTMSADTQLQLTLPNTALTNALLEFRFTAGYSATGADDIFISGLTMSTNSPATASASSIVQPFCSSPTGTVTLNTQSNAVYKMDNGAYQTSATFSGIAPGSHTFTVANAVVTSCTSTAFPVTIVSGETSVAPTLSGNTIVNTCPEATTNLNSLITGTLPSGASVEWFTTSVHSGAAYTTPAAAAAGTYYAFYKDANNGSCYSPATAAVTATVTACCPTIAPILN